MVSLYDTLDCAALEQDLPRLRALFSANAALHERSGRFIAAAGSLYGDSLRTARGCVLLKKARRYASSLASRTLPSLGPFTGRESLRFASAITPLGVHSYAACNAKHCEQVYVFDDRFGALAGEFLSTIRDSAIAGGYDVTVCRSFLAPYERIEAVFVDSESLCFISSTALSGVLPEGAVRVRESRFYDAAALSAVERRLAFSKKAMLALLGQAAELMAEAKAVHDEIESIYTPRVNFEQVRTHETALCEMLGL
ncbi:MAG: hypothetical protein RR998_04635 [Oscillospiraceae bacterium]